MPPKWTFGPPFTNLLKYSNLHLSVSMVMETTQWIKSLPDWISNRKFNLLIHVFSVSVYQILFIHWSKESCQLLQNSKKMHPYRLISMVSFHWFPDVRTLQVRVGVRLSNKECRWRIGRRKVVLLVPYCFWWWLMIWW